MTFSSGAVLTAAQLNDLSITSVDVADGNVSTPSIANTGDLNTGIYWPAADSIGVSAGGAQRTVWGTADTQHYGPSGTAALFYLRSPDTAPHTTTEGDVALYFGDGDDSAQAGFYWDVSAQELHFRGYNATTRFRINADGQTLFDAGTLALPSIGLQTNVDTGVYFSTANNVDIGCNGTRAFTFGVSANSTYLPVRAADGSAGAPAYTFTTDPDTGMFLNSDGDLRLAVAGSSIIRVRAGDVIPNTNGTIELGLTTARWQEVWTVDVTTTNAVTVDSDMRLKTPTGYGLGLDFLRGLAPFEGVWTDGDDRRVHQWLSAQEIAARLELFGYDPAETSLWSTDETGSQRIAYGELIPPVVAALQELDARLAAVETGQVAA